MCLHNDYTSLSIQTCLDNVLTHLKTMSRHILVMLMVLSMAPLHHNDHNEVKHNFSVMWCHSNQHCCHIILTASPTASFWSLGEDNWNKLCDMTLLAMWCFWHQFEHHDMGGTISFARSWWLKQCVIWPFLVMWCYCWHHMTLGFITNTIAFVHSRWSKGHATWLFGHVMPLTPASASCDTNCIISYTTAFV